MALDPRLDDVADISDLSGADLALVVELQRKELDRLLRENAQLHARVNQLIGLQEREQVLRPADAVHDGHTQGRDADCFARK